MSFVRATALCALAAALALASPDALAQRRRPAVRRPGGRATPAAPAVADPTDAAELEPPEDPVPDTETLVQLIQVAAVSGTADGARSISALLLRGLPPRAAAAALDALSILGRPEGAPAVLRFLLHRRVSLRRHAVAAAQALHTPALVRALAARLGDEDEHVRYEAAGALADVGDRSIVPALFDAFEHDLQNTANANVGRLAHDCARAIAHAGNADEVVRLLGFLRRAPFNTMSDSLRIALGRTDLPMPTRQRIVAAVGDLATREVKRFLETFADELPARESALAASARAAAERISQ